MRGKCLGKACLVINGDRQDTYGGPEDSFKTIGQYWQTYLESVGFKVKIKPGDVAIMMSLMKHARMAGQKYKQDNFIDAAGYIGIADDLKAEEDNHEDN